MGILNVTPDSFSDGGRFSDKSTALSHALQMVRDGADIIDIGGESTRPGSKPVSEEEELARVIPVIEELAGKSEVLISIDTQKAKVAREALLAGAHMVNDVSAGTSDANMFKVVAEFNALYVMMHMQGTPENMQDSPQYRNVVEDIIQYFNVRMQLAEAQGVRGDHIILDPGVGFGKTLENNLEIMARMESFREIGCRTMLGASRKSFIGMLDNSKVDQRLGGSIAAVLAGHLGKVDIFRVHDVGETRQALHIFTTIQNHLD